MARVIMVGVSVVWVALAYLLCKEGHQVTFVDRNDAPGQGSSRANRAQLSYSCGDALASPSSSVLSLKSYWVAIRLTRQSASGP